MTKVLVIGEAPSKWMTENGITEPLPLASRDLSQLAGLSWPDEWNEKFECINVLDQWPGRSPNGKNDLWPVDLARRAALTLVPKMQGLQSVVLLGHRVADAFGLRDSEFFAWQPIHGTRVTVTPHPSASRWWDDPANRLKARVFWSGVSKG